LVFVELALSSSGGALAPAHRILVDKRGWLTAREFTEILALSQVLPGPNIVNVAIYVGTRYRGAPGAVAAFAGLLLAPLVVIVPLMVLYAQSGDNELLRGTFRGVAAAAAGLMVATSLKVALPYRHSLRAVLLAALAFAGVSLLHWPLIVVVLVLAPCGILAAWRGWL
jgi:chromate transporter